jgi:hypothetical protein
MATTPEQFHTASSPKPEAAQQQEANEDSAKLFDEVLKDKFGQVPEVTFQSGLPGTELIILKPLKGSSEGGKKAFWATLTYRNEQGKEKERTWVMMDDGRFVNTEGVPKGLAFSSEDLKREILHHLKAIDIGFWRGTPFDFTPGSDEGESVERIGGGGDPKKRPVDETRLKFLEDQERILFGRYSEKSGLNDYKIAFLLPQTKGRPPIAVLDNQYIGNAAYVYPFPEGTQLEIDESVFSRPPDMRIDYEEGERILKELWGPVREKGKQGKITRNELRDLGAVRIEHRGKDWKKRLQKAIDEATQ